RLERRPLAPSTVRPHLRRDEDVVAGNPALGERATDLLLVAVGARGVDVPVSELERCDDGRFGALAACEPGPEPEQRHVRAGRDLDEVLTRHARILPGAAILARTWFRSG